MSLGNKRKQLRGEVPAQDPLTRGEMVKILNRFAQRLESGQCPRCGTKMTDRERIGRCSYAVPCGCRLGVTS